MLALRNNFLSVRFCAEYDLGFRASKGIMLLRSIALLMIEPNKGIRIVLKVLMVDVVLNEV